MKKETLSVAVSNQKGGVGKSAVTILLASHLHYVKGLNVAVIDCDAPQHSLYRMRERDIQTVEGHDAYKQMILLQWKRIQKKAYPIIGTTAEKAREAAMEISATGKFDIVFVDLPGTVNSKGVFSTILGMDYIITPVIADRIVIQSSLSFSATIKKVVKERGDLPLKDIMFLWNKRDRRKNTEVFDATNTILRELGLTVLDTILPDTCRYDKELSSSGKGYFRCTLLPPPAKLMKGSGIAELADELITKLNIRT